MRALLYVGLLVLAGCIHDDLVACPGDTLCAVDLQCDTIHGGCITADQATACIGMPDHMTCVAGDVHGYCLDQICVDPGCGNHIVDDGELCDDGNTRDGDGCSATCSSREICGDGALDRHLGEDCDDGNLASRDGCDSLCRVETPVWSVDPLGPTTTGRGLVFDPDLGQSITVTDGYVWGWNGTTWTMLADDAPDPGSQSALGYDPADHLLVLLSPPPQTGDIVNPQPAWNQLDTWDGTTWTHRVLPDSVSSPAPTAQRLQMTFDANDKKMFLFGSTSIGVIAGELDAVAASYGPIASPASSNAPAGFGLAFDVKRNVLVVVVAGSGPANPTVYEWNGFAWTTSAPAMASPGRWAILYDSAIEGVLAIGRTSSFGQSTPVQQWNGTTWTDLTPIQGSLTDPEATFDTTRQVRVVFGGGEPEDQIVESSGTSWKVAARYAPPYDVDSSCTYDTPRARMVCSISVATRVALTSYPPRETWAYDGTWTHLNDGSSPPSAVAYDPIRDVVIGWGYGEFLRLTGTTWQTLSTDFANTDFIGNALAFEPGAGRVIGVARPTLVGFPITIILSSSTSHVTQTTTAGYRSLAYDARNHEMLALQLTGDAAHLVGDAWSPVVGPGSLYTPASNPRRGTVEFFAAGERTVERIGEKWVDESSPPPIPVRGAVVVDPITGDLHILGLQGNSRFMLHRRWMTASAAEDCASTADLDSDGLAGCGDPDCWTTCTPACPPYASCP